MELRPSGEVTISPFPQIDPAQQPAESHNVGKLAMPDDSAILGMRVVSEDVVVFSESYVKVKPFLHIGGIVPKLMCCSTPIHLLCRF